MPMTLFDGDTLPRAQAIADLVYQNPFLPDRIALERQALGDAYVDAGPVWSLSATGNGSTPNIAPIRELAERLVRDARRRLLDTRGRVTPTDATLYADLCLYVLYSHYNDLLHARSRSTRELFATMREEYDALFAPLLEHRPAEPPPEPAHVFACFFQVIRAFVAIVETIVGTTPPAAKLRAEIWQSTFTHDLRRYRRSLYDKTGDFTTLVTGESGTGKELVARAIGASRYLPFDAAKGKFVDDVAGGFVAVNLSALAPTLVESELFGHRRGAFTGAVADRVGWLEQCPPRGTIFLDEIGELDPAVQVKLLRVLQSRTFERLGDTRTLSFRGKVIAATNRTLAKEIAAGRFRQDLFYRLCADVIETPPLRELLN
ncbi:sigma-54 factor interaction domain-containing protein, partial [bacterium]